MNKFTGTTITTIYILYIILEIQKICKDVDRKISLGQCSIVERRRAA